MSIFKREGYPNSRDKLVGASAYYIEVLNSMYETLVHFNLIDKTNLSTTDYGYWGKQVRRAKELNIEVIKMDIMNNIDLYSISLKYFQPISVIKEIKENKYNSKLNIVPSKIYTIKMISKLFNLKYWDRRKLDNINGKEHFSNYDKTKDTKFFTGKFIIANLHCFNTQTLKMDGDGEKYISERQASIMVLGNKTNRLDLDTDGKIFGIKISTKKFKNITGFLVEDCASALVAKRKYIKRDTIKSYYKLADHLKSYVRTEYLKKYKKELSDKYITKKEGIYIDKLAKKLLEERKIIKLTLFSTYLSLEPHLRKVTERVLEFYKFEIYKGQRKNETYGILPKDRDCVQKILTKLLFKQISKRKAEHPIIPINDLANLLTMSQPTIKNLIERDGSLFGVKVSFEKSMYNGLGISRDLVVKILENQSKYISTFKTGIWDGLSGVRRTMVRKEFKKYFYTQNLILESEYKNLLGEIEYQVFLQEKRQQLNGKGDKI